ncbi:MAG: acetyl-CoA hydrolase/transferase family protein [Deltaproteobacteria bacterium]|jgi:acyl-CoA hydrolase|nr:acetyl-CoA hydrolase/transferase family protein [Deltaproteobacteria bacterium]
MKTPVSISPVEAAALLRPIDRMVVPLGPGQPIAFLNALGQREDWRDLQVFAALLVAPFALFTRPGVELRSGFFGPVERAFRAAGHGVSFVPADFRRYAEIGRRFAPRVLATAAAPPDSEGRLSLSLHAGASITGIAEVARDPDRLLVVETSPAYPRTLGLPPEHPHSIHVDEVDVWIESDAAPIELPELAPTEVDEAIAGHVATFIPDGATLQTGIGGVPDAVARLLAQGEGGDYGIHTEMFTSGLMRLHEAGKITNRKGVLDGHSIATFAMGSRALYDWLEECESVRFLPVDVVNDPAIMARNRQMVSINGALSVDLFAQVAADTIDGTQHSGIGGHEDFLAGAGLTQAGRSLICLPSTVEVAGELRSRIVPVLGPGVLTTSPRHQVDVVVTEYGAAELAGRTVEERARALTAIAHPDLRSGLEDAARQIAGSGILSP